MSITSETISRGLQGPHERLTASAVIVMPRFGWIEQRYLDDAQFTEAAVAENQAVIDAFAEGRPYVLMNVFPAGMRVSLPLMDKDHYRDRRESDPVRAIAVVTDSAEMHTATKLYFLYHQQRFASEVFDDEEDARAWLRTFMG